MSDGEGFAFAGDGEGFCKIKMFVFFSAVAFEIDVDFSGALCFRLNICVQHLAAEISLLVSAVEACDDFSGVRLLEKFARIKNNIAALKGKETSAKVQIQAEDGNGAVNLYLEGNRGAEKKHYFTAQQFAVSERAEIVHTKLLPEDVNGIAVRLDLNKPAVYRIFNAAISAK